MRVPKWEQQKIRNYEDMLEYCTNYVRTAIKKKKSVVPTLIIVQTNNKKVWFPIIIRGAAKGQDLQQIYMIALTMVAHNASKNARVIGLIVPTVNIYGEGTVIISARDKDNFGTIGQEYYGKKPKFVIGDIVPINLPAPVANIMWDMQLE